MMDTKFNIASNEYLPLRDVVFNTLRDAILTGSLIPGERLMENQLADKLGVSRTPVREALRMLELENLVELVPRKGAQVLDMSEKDVVDILEIRSALEALATRIASEKMTDEEVARLYVFETDFERAIKEEDTERIVSVDEEFHDLIFASTENMKLIQMYQNLRIQLYRYRMAHAKKDSTIKAIVEHHKEIIKAIESRSAADAADAARIHIQYHTEFILNSMKNKK